MKGTLRQNETNNPTWGFTLIEIMIVIAVIGILSVVTMPRYKAFQDHYHLESAAQIITNDLRLAKQLAMDRRETITVNLLDNSVNVKFGTTQVFDDQKFNAGVTSTANVFTFDFHGFVTSGSVSVVLRKGNSTVILNIEAQTGNTTQLWQ